MHTLIEGWIDWSMNIFENSLRDSLFNIIFKIKRMGYGREDTGLLLMRRMGVISRAGLVRKWVHRLSNMQRNEDT